MSDQLGSRQLLQDELTPSASGLWTDDHRREGNCLMTQHDVHRREYGIASSALFKPKFRRDRSPAPRGHPVYPVTSPEFKPVFIPRSDDDVKLT